MRPHASTGCHFPLVLRQLWKPSEFCAPQLSGESCTLKNLIACEDIHLKRKHSVGGVSDHAAFVKATVQFTARLIEVEALRNIIMASGAKEELFKPIQSSQSGDEQPESHGRRLDLTADSDVKAPGVIQRAVEEVEAIASEIWAAVTPSKK